MFLSIIIPTFNRSAQLSITLESVCNAIETSPNKAMIELIVIDNGSTDATADLVERFKLEYGSISILYFYDSISGLLTGRHKGANESQGAVLTFIDDDVCVSSTWLDTIVDVMQTNMDITFLTGPNLPLYESYPPGWINYFWSDTPYGGKMCEWLSLLDLGSKPIDVHPNFVWGLNFTIRKADFLLLGGFHPDNISPLLQMYQGDGETGLTVKGAQLQKKALYHPGVMLYHQTSSERLTIEYFDKRAYYQGICNSYTSIRKDNGLYGIVTADQPANRSLLYYVNKARNIITSNTSFSSMKLQSSEEEKLKHRFSLKSQAGFEYHQYMFQTNENVKNWVLRKDYFNYKLPEL